MMLLSAKESQHAIADNRNIAARRSGTCHLRQCANAAGSIGDYADGDRRRQIAERNRCASPLQSGGGQHSARREVQRLARQQYPLSALRNDSNLGWRGDQNSNGRGRAVYRCGDDCGTQRGKRRSIELYPVLPCPGGGPGSARRFSACRGLPIDYKRCCTDRLSPPPKADILRCSNFIVIRSPRRRWRAATVGSQGQAISRI